MSELADPFVVETTFQLPGLGVLVLPATPVPSWLAAYPLHTALIIILPASIAPQPINGTVEEISQQGQPIRQALLLDLGANISLLAGTHLQTIESSSNLI